MEWQEGVEWAKKLKVKKEKKTNIVYGEQIHRRNMRLHNVSRFNVGR